MRLDPGQLLGTVKIALHLRENSLMIKCNNRKLLIKVLKDQVDPYQAT